VRVVLHHENVKLEVEERGSIVYLEARDTSTGLLLESQFEWDKYPLFQAYRRVAVELIAGIRPQLDALANASRPASRAVESTTPPGGQTATSNPPPPPP
jgi:hypothetical protein